MIQVDPNLIDRVTRRIRETVSFSSHGDCHQLTFMAMSTRVRIQFRSATVAIADQYQRAVVEWTAQFEARYSRFIAGSIISQINDSAGGDWQQIDDETVHLFFICDQMFTVTRNAFDAASLPLIRLWNWKTDSPVIPKAEAIESAREISGWDKIELGADVIRLPKRGMGIDLGGIGKEYAVDQLFRMGQRRGLPDLLVDIGQDIRVFGKSPGKNAWCIGLEEPEKAGECWTALSLNDRAVATSGGYLRNFIHNGKRYGHIVDPRTGEPVFNDCQR